MRLLIIAALSIGITGSALAQPPLESCTEVPDLAANVMASRQMNADIMLMINKMNGEFNDDPALLSWAQAMIDMAYGQLVPATPEARTQQVEEFRTLWNERCLGLQSK
ncbi:MAG: hypothetical protein V4751_06965 [Pseudomonadota bacterium]